MTNEEKRIAIAEAVGFRIELFIHRHEGGSGFMRWKSPKGEWLGYNNDDQPRISVLPDYLNDVNAMYEVEEWWIKAKGGNWMDLQGNLQNICSDEDEFMWHASAAMRADAFLLTIGKVL